jgi:DNA-binding response OmpR family regulator
MTNAKILVIDDEQNIIDLVTAYLNQENYEVHTALDGPSGLKAARSLKPDLIVLDIMLPGLDGIDLLSQLRRESDVYVIMLTAKSEETDKIIGLSVGADDYLTKPFSPRELVARIKAGLRRYDQHSGGDKDRSMLTFRFEEKGVNLELDLPADLPVIHADEDRLSQVLLNLVGNALQYTPPAGTVTIAVEKRSAELLITIRDTGVGIPAEHLPHLFTRFYRVDKSRSRVGGGSGIGLTIVKHLVEAHGGHVWADSEGINAGSTFGFSLPI